MNQKIEVNGDPVIKEPEKIEKKEFKTEILNGIPIHIFPKDKVYTTQELKEIREHEGLSKNSFTLVVDINPKLAKEEVLEKIVDDKGNCLGVIYTNGVVVIDHHIRLESDGPQLCTEFELNGKKIAGETSTAPLLIKLYNYLEKGNLENKLHLQKLKEAWNNKDICLATNHYDGDSISSLIIATQIEKKNEINKNTLHQNLLEKLATFAFDADHKGGHMFLLAHMEDPAQNLDKTNTQDMLFAKIIGLMETVGENEAVGLTRSVNQALLQENPEEHLSKILDLYTEKLSLLIEKVNSTKLLAQRVKRVKNHNNCMYLIIDENKTIDEPETHYDATFLKALINQGLASANEPIPEYYIFAQKRNNDRWGITLRVNEIPGKEVVPLNDAYLAVILRFLVGVEGRDKAGSNSRLGVITIGNTQVLASLAEGLSFETKPRLKLTKGATIEKNIEFLASYLDKSINALPIESIIAETLVAKGKIKNYKSATYKPVATNAKEKNFAGIVTITTYNEESGEEYITKYFIKYTTEQSGKAVQTIFKDYLKPTIIQEKLGIDEVPIVTVDDTFLALNFAGIITQFGEQKPVNIGNLTGITEIVKKISTHELETYRAIGVKEYTTNEYFLECKNMFEQICNDTLFSSYVDVDLQQALFTRLQNQENIRPPVVGTTTFKRSNIVEINGKPLLTDFVPIIAPRGLSIAAYVVNYARYNPEKALLLMKEMNSKLNLANREELEISLIFIIFSNILYNKKRIELHQKALIERIAELSPTQIDSKRNEIELTKAKLAVLFEMLKGVLNLPNDAIEKALYVRKIFEKSKSPEESMQQAIKYGYA